MNPLALITMLKPGSWGPHVGEMSTLGSADTLTILASPKIPIANTIVVNAKLLT
jgi:hypothetical protein